MPTVVAIATVDSTRLFIRALLAMTMITSDATWPANPRTNIGCYVDFAGAKSRTVQPRASTREEEKETARDGWTATAQVDVKRHNSNIDEDREQHR